VSGDDSAQPGKTNQGHHASADPQINDVANNHPLQPPADNSLLTAAQHDDNGSPAVTDGAHPGHGQVDGSESASPKLADDGSTSSGNVAHDPPALTALPSDVSGDDSAQPGKTNQDHHASADPQINDVANNHPLQPPADNSLLAAAQPEDNGSPAVTDGDSFKFADNDSAHPGTIPNYPPALTAPSNDLSGNHEAAAPALAKPFDVSGTVMSAAPDQFMFAENTGHGPSADHKTDMTEIDHTVSTDIQQVLDTAHDTNAVSALDPNHGTAPQDMANVQLPHHQGDFHFA
jgi:hypothetical protein